MKRIICIGNRYVQEDALGPAVYDHLRRTPLPADVQLIDGGLAGLNLLRFLDGAQRVVFVDVVTGFKSSGSMVILEGDELAQLTEDRYDHAAGLPYLLKALPAAIEGTPPQVLLLGWEGPAGPDAIEQLAAVCLQLAEHGCLSPTPSDGSGGSA